MRKHLLFYLICVILCAAVGLSSFFFPADMELERKQTTEHPTLITGNGTLNSNFSSEVDVFLSERTPFRSAALNVKAFLMEIIFRTSPVDSVIIGKQGWLFFKDTVNEYIGASSLTDREVFIVIDTLKQINNYCKSKGADFLFAVAPDKNMLYPEYMPERYLRSEDNSYTRLMDGLERTDIPYIDFRDFAQASSEPLYYKTDTHWNTKGAVLAYNRIMDKLKIRHNDYKGVQYITAERTGDLERMLHPQKPLQEQEKKLNYDFSFDYCSRLKSEDDIKIQTKNEVGHGSLLMFRDSFANALLPLFAENFKDAYFSRAIPCDLTLTERMSADTILYEIVQRNIKNIIAYAPILPAENVSLDVSDVSPVSESEIHIEDGGLTHIFGVVEPDYLKDNSKIYIKLTFPDQSAQMYECFNIFEASRLDKTNEYNGFSCYLRPETISNKNFQVEIIIA